MKKKERIARYGEAAYEKMLAQKHERYKAHREEIKARIQKWREENPEEVMAYNRNYSRKGGKHYNKKLEYGQTGLQGDKNKIRRKHAREYHPFKKIIAPESQIHHEWIPKTAEYNGLALVEADQHMHGYVDVIRILDGEITLLTEEDVRNGCEING